MKSLSRVWAWGPAFLFCRRQLNKQSGSKCEAFAIQTSVLREGLRHNIRLNATAFPRMRIVSHSG